jgi:hypothetical protein
MDRERELALRKSIELGRRKLESMMEELPTGAHDLSDEWLSASIELDDSERELEYLLDNPADSDEGTASVGAPRKPAPHLNSDAIALPEPEEPGS